MKHLHTLLIPLVLFACNQNSDTFKITDFGAKGDNKTINTTSINEAILACHEHGGGKVVVPPGTYLTGTIEILSNVEFFIEAGAMLLGSTDTSDYKPMSRALFSEGYNRYGLIHITDAKNITISGMGEINGNGTHFMDKTGKTHLGGPTWKREFTRQGENYLRIDEKPEDGPVAYSYRPGMLITINRCERLKISDLILSDTPEWTIRLEDSEDVEFSGLTIISNPLVPNSDGIHITSSCNVTVSNCKIFTGDDAIIVTGFGDGLFPTDPIPKGYIGNHTGYAENVVVTNCILSSRSSCIRVGYGQHPIRNLTFSNIVMKESNRGIGVFSRDQTSIENVLFDNIIIETRLHSGAWWGNGEPIHISAVKSSKDGYGGEIKNIRFSNILATGESGVIVYGTNESLIKNVQFNNFQLTLKKGKHSEDYGGNFDLRPAYPISMGIFKHDIPAFYADFVTDLSLKDFKVKWGIEKADFFTHAIEISNFRDITIEGVSGSAAFNSYADIQLTNGKTADINVPGAVLKKINVQ